MKMMKGRRFVENSVIQYLLKVPGCNREEIESRLFLEDNFSEVLESAERELFDLYVRNELSPHVRTQVETELLFSERQMDKLRVAKALLRNPRRRTRFVAAGAIAAALICAASLTWVTALALRSPRAALPAPSRQSSPARAPRILTFLLTPGVVRGSELASLHITPTADLVRFELADPHPAPSYSASLSDSSQTVIWHRDQLRARNGGVTLTVPAAMLHAGQFRLVLDGRPPTVYYFRVQ